MHRKRVKTQAEKIGHKGLAVPLKAAGFLLWYAERGNDVIRAVCFGRFNWQEVVDGFEEGQ